ncbi:MAG: hypothetical protein HRU20_03870 [Pseudomonadales bacterium]|nr:hypothetical protein [Pseudomonadales bacterium]
MTFSVSKLLLASSASLILAACSSGGSDGDPADKTANGISSNEYIADSSVRMRSIDPNEKCPNGGVQIEMGIDSNGNGVLDDAEIDANRTEVVCHGSNSTGAGGSLITVTDAPLSECSEGGKLVSIGQDLDGDNQLAVTEVTQTESICNAVLTSAGGLSSLVNTSAESAGVNCSTGGIKIDAGLDKNSDTLLSADEIQSTSYVCNGQEGLIGNDGADGSVTGIENLLIESFAEQAGDNCLHGGYRNQVGIDVNLNNVLDAAEVTSASYSCYENSPPKIYNNGNLEAIAGGEYTINFSSYDDDQYKNLEGDYVWGDATQISITEKPDWLQVNQISNDNLQLIGTAPDSVGSSFVIKASATDGELIATDELTIEIKDGIAIQLSADSITEGDSGFQTASFTISLSTTATETLTLSYELSSYSATFGSDWNSTETSGNLIFAPGETSKQISVDILGDTDFEINESISFSIHTSHYPGTELIFNPGSTSMQINNDDALVLYAEQDNAEVVYNTPNYIDNVVLENHPAWMSVESQYGAYAPPYYYNMGNIVITGKPGVDKIGTQGTFDISILGAESIQETFSYKVVEGDRDLDGIANSSDAFPDNAEASTDSDSDGLGDEWEMNNFESLTMADASSDYDNNGVSDLYAFQNNTPINDFNTSFEDGSLPAGWVNSGDVNWVVTNAKSYEGSYALTLAEALLPGQTAQVSFTVNAQAGTMEVPNYFEAGNNYWEHELQISSSNGQSNYQYDYIADSWDSYPLNLSISAGQQVITITYSNYSYDAVAPMVYLDALSSLVGIVPADRDGDGVLNSDDLFPDNAMAQTDSDNDGIADEWENLYFNSLTSVDAVSDFDGDGLSDIDEFLKGTSPTNTDSDSDNIADGVDIAPNDSRYHSDNDNDDLPDNWELEHFGSLTISDGSQDSDGDSVSDAEEFLAGTMPALDTDGDGVADLSDAFPNDSRYQKDSDNDGMADKWENQYDNYPTYCYLYELSDCDGDGRSDLQEFLDGTDPTVINLTTKEDIITVAQGQTITFNPTANDTSVQQTVTSSITDLPVSGTLVDNQDGTFSYTATNDRLGWLRLAYTADDGVTTDSGEIFIHIVEDAPAKLTKIESSQNGADFSAALFDDGTVYTWGSNSQGQLGIVNPIDNVPGLVTSLPLISDIVLGNDFAVALASNDGTVWAWGKGTTTPVQVTGLSGVLAITADNYSTYVINTDKTVSRVSSSGTVSTIAGLSNINQISAGSGHLLALDGNGDVWAYSYNASNYFGQLGNVDNTGSTPMKVSKISDIRTIEAGANQSFAITNTGQLYAWGNNEYGNLGDATTINRTVPVLIEAVENVQAIDTSYYHTLLVNSSGQLYGMGYGYSGALFSNDYYVYTPMLLTDETVQLFAAGDRSTFFANTNGESFALGNNSYGQLGNGTRESTSEPMALAWLLDGVISELGKEGFEWGRIPPYWRNTTNNWEVVSDDVSSGNYAMRVKDRLNDNQNASLGLQITTGAGPVSFRYKTSTEQDWDALVFYIDGVEQVRLSGESQWNTSATFDVTAGIHRFEWVYSKDGGTSAGNDTVWLDDILLPVDTDGDGVIDTADADPYSALIQ